MSAEKKDKTPKQHQYYSTTPEVWRTLKRENQIDKTYLIWARKITLYNFFLSPFQFIQRFFFNKKINAISFEDKQPLFILGHWRSGTTHLHYLLSRDPRYAFLSNYQAYLFNIALLGRKLVKTIVTPFFPETRLQDDMIVSPDEPAEEERPLSTSSTCSGIHSFIFTKNQSYFQKFNLFKDISATEKISWQQSYLFVLKSIAYYNSNNQLVLKNPHNTSRIKELLELFPNAKFIFIYRNLFDMYQSTLHLFEKNLRSLFLQDLSGEEIEEMVITNLTNLLRKYIDEKDLIPKQNLIEISFADLEQNAMTQIKSIYKHLRLNNFEIAKPHIEEYLVSTKNYNKNVFPDLPPELKDRLKKEWEFFFEKYEKKGI